MCEVPNSMNRIDDPEPDERSNPLETIVSDNFDPKKDNEYAYKTVEEYEEILGQKVNDAFRIGWDMARTKNKHLRELAERSR